jgi:hypothetical protein
VGKFFPTAIHEMDPYAALEEFAQGCAHISSVTEVGVDHFGDDVGTDGDVKVLEGHSLCAQTTHFVDEPTAAIDDKYRGVAIRLSGAFKNFFECHVAFFRVGIFETEFEESHLLAVRLFFKAGQRFRVSGGDASC